MNVTCKIYWTETSTSDECDLPKTKEHGFVQNPEVVANVVSTLPENFCASAKHNSSPNTYSIDSAALISEGTGCGAGGSAQTASFKNPENFECISSWMGPGTLIDKPGHEMHGWCVVVNYNYSTHADGDPKVVGWGRGGSVHAFPLKGGTRSERKMAAKFQESMEKGNSIVVKDLNTPYPHSALLSTFDDQGGVNKVDDSGDGPFSEWNSIGRGLSESEVYIERKKETCRVLPNHFNCIGMLTGRRLNSTEKWEVTQEEHCRVMPHDSICQ
jgi:hypothetical protein